MEELETKLLLSKLVSMIEILIPEQFSIAYLADSTGKSRQAILKHLERHCEFEKDWFRAGEKKIFVRKEAGIRILQHYKVSEIAQAA